MKFFGILLVLVAGIWLIVIFPWLLLVIALLLGLGLLDWRKHRK